MISSSSIDIEKKIKALRTVEDIISAMKAYAGVAIRKTEELVLSIRTYEENILQALADVLTHYQESLLEEQRGRKRILIAFGSSQGLCGPFNEKIVDVIMDTFSNNDTLFVIGKRLKSSIELRGIQLDGYTDSIISINGIEHALKDTISQIMDMYKKREYYNLSIIFTSLFVKKAEISIEQILPPDINRSRGLRATKVLPLTYVEPEYIFNKVLEEFLYISLYRGFIESLRSENWYRLRSMEGASESIKRRISELDSFQKYVRQEEITEEMLEILGSGMFYR
ncbi:MAG: F0F1 ATP synthase subunit gamma [Nitrospirota bacterium]|nr:F0F1 ATP synthase subunit gamma [Nitrospirota bacterium]